MYKNHFKCISISVFAIALCLFSAGCNEKDNASQTQKQSTESTAEKTAQKTTQSPKPEDTDGIKENAEPKTKVLLDTNMGQMVIQLYPEKAPVTVENFLTYVNEKFYDGLVFHRVIPGFMIQGGGFDADMVEKLDGKHMPIENEAGNGLKNKRGTIAMARTNDPDSATSQFFINVNDNQALNYRGPMNPGYAVFGKVIKGMSVADAIVKVPTTTKRSNTGKMLANNPKDPVIIKSARVVPSLDE